MHDDDTQLVKLEEEPRLAIWVVYHRLLRQEAEKIYSTDAASAIDCCYTVGDNGEGIHIIL